MSEAGRSRSEHAEQLQATLSSSPPSSPWGDPIADVVSEVSMVALIFEPLGMQLSLLAGATCRVWHEAARQLVESWAVLRPSHSLGWGNEVLSQFKSPSGITLLPNGDLCVADTNNHRLQVLCRTGEVKAVLGMGPGGAMGEFQQPTGVVCDGNALYVADSGNCRLHKLSLPSGDVLSMVGTFGDAPGQLAQDLFDLMFADMDRNLRELGTGDLAVGKRIKKLAKAFFGRIAAYEDGIF